MKSKSSPCYFCWILVIAIGTFCGTAAKDLLEWKLTEMALSGAFDSSAPATSPEPASTVPDPQPAPSDSDTSDLEICNFWRNEFKHNPSNRNRIQMNSACAIVSEQ